MVVVQTWVAAATASQRRQVVCEKCGCRYAYDVTRRGGGRSANRGRAQRQAQTHLARKIATAVEPVACPDCGWYQADMVAEIRRRQHRWTSWAAIFVPVLGVFTVAIVGAVLDRSSGDFFDKNAVLVLILVGLAILAGPAFPLVRRFLARRLDPNANYPAMPDPNPDAPPAIREGFPAAGDSPAYSSAWDPRQPESNAVKPLAYAGGARDASWRLGPGPVHGHGLAVRLLLLPGAGGDDVRERPRHRERHDFPAGVSFVQVWVRTAEEDPPVLDVAGGRGLRRGIRAADAEGPEGAIRDHWPRRWRGAGRPDLYRTDGALLLVRFTYMFPWLAGKFDRNRNVQRIQVPQRRLHAIGR